MKIHILQVVHSLVIGGAERVVCDLVRAFNDGEFTTSVCCLDELGEFGEDLQADGYSVDVLGRKPGINKNLILKLREIYKHRQVDLIHAHQYTPYFYAASASLLNERKPVIFTEHGRHYPDYLRIKRAFFNQLLRLTTAAYTGVSEFTRKSLISFEKMPAERIKVIYNGIWLNGKGQGDRDGIKPLYGLKESDLLILSIGRMDPVKDFLTLIKAFALMKEQFPQAYLWIAGGGDINYFKKVEDLIKELKLEDKVALLGSRRDIQNLLCACDLFILPSITEAASMTILEAMASGKAVIAIKTGGNSEIVIHGETGLLVNVGDPVDLSTAMSRLLKNPLLREDMGKAGRRRVEDKFSMEKILKQYSELYLKALKS